MTEFKSVFDWIHGEGMGGRMYKSIKNIKSICVDDINNDCGILVIFMHFIKLITSILS